MDPAKQNRIDEYARRNQPSLETNAYHPLGSPRNPIFVKFAKRRAAEIGFEIALSLIGGLLLIVIGEMIRGRIRGKQKCICSD